MNCRVAVAMAVFIVVAHAVFVVVVVVVLVLLIVVLLLCLPNYSEPRHCLHWARIGLGWRSVVFLLS